MSDTTTSLSHLIDPVVADMLARLDQLQVDLDQRLKDRPGPFLDAVTSNDFEMLEAVDDLRDRVEGLKAKAVFQSCEAPLAERLERRRETQRMQRAIKSAQREGK
jgi:hypothetical protein